MGLYQRKKAGGGLASPFWWKKFPIDPATKRRTRPDESTKIHIDGGSRAQTAKNKADALLQYQQDCTTARAPHAKPRITFRDYAPGWLDTYARGHKSYANEASTVAILVEGLGDYFLDELTAPVIAVWRAKKATEVKARTADRYIDVLRPMLAKAGRYIDDNPISGRDRMGNAKWQTLKWEEVAKRWFTREEFGRFVRAIESQDAILDTPRIEGLLLAYTAVETLLRRGSLLHLTWAHYRGASAAYAFPHFLPLNAKVEIKYSPVSPNLQQYLDQLPRDTPGGRIFASHFRTTEGPRALGSAEAHVTRWFERVCSLAGLPYGLAVDGLTFHALRHSGATWLLSEGHDVKKVMELGGWKSAQLFLDTYCHTTEAAVFAMSAAMFADNVKVVPFATPPRKAAQR